MKKKLLLLLVSIVALKFSADAQVLVPISEGINSNGSSPYWFSKLGDHRYIFRAKNPSLGYEPYFTDGTQPGTILLKDINPGIESSNPDYDMSFHRINDSLTIFNANDGNSNHGSELWRTDGSESGTYMITDLSTGAASSDIFFYNLTLNNKIFFNCPAYQGALWITDGSSQGTIQLTDSNDAQLFATANGIGYFYVKDWNNLEVFLWRTDGTVNGTFALKLVQMNSLSIEPGASSGNEFIFPTVDSLKGNELWKTDGSIQGTTLVKDIDSSSDNSILSNFLSVNNKLLFRNYKSQSIWVTDGTDTGTYQLGDSTVFSSLNFSYPIVVLDTVAYFQVADYISGTTSIWETDGSISGNVLLHTFPAINYGYTFENVFVNVSGLTYFIVSQSLYFGELSSIWATDGTESGTYEVYANPDAYNSPIWQLTGVCDELFCEMSTGYSGEFNGIWKIEPDTAYAQNLFSIPHQNPYIYLVDDSSIFLTLTNDSYQTELYRYEVCGVYTSTPTISSQNSLSLFPNPNNGNFNIQLPQDLNDGIVTVTDMSGRILYSQNVSEATNNSLDLDLENFEAGIYLLQINSNAKRWQQIFVKQ